MNTTISATQLIPLSANYDFGDIQLKTRVSKWKDGYTTYSQPLFTNNIDCSINKSSIFYLTSSNSLFDIIEENNKDVVQLGDFITLQIDAKYVSNVDNELYLTETSGYDSFFKVIANEDSTYSFLQGTGLYVTVDNQTPYNLNLEPKLEENEMHHQKFTIEIKGTELYIVSNIINESGVGPSNEQRFWGYTKFGPEAGRLRCNGTINNNYLFTISNFNITYKPSGLTRDHTWVSYYNNLEDTKNNKNVEINESKSLSGIKINHLVDLPYNNTINISSTEMVVNLANMKTIQTSTYEYRKK